MESNEQERMETYLHERVAFTMHLSCNEEIKLTPDLTVSTVHSHEG